jgi:hypothetical protein
MSDLHHTGRRSVLAGIGAAALAASFNPPLVLAQAAAQPQYVGPAAIRGKGSQRHCGPDNRAKWS